MDDRARLRCADFLQLMLLEHTGQVNGITAAALAAKTGLSERDVRHYATVLRMEGHPICAHPSTGYFMARDEAELLRTIDFLRQRGIHHLQIASQLAKMPLEDFFGQLKLPT